MDKRRISAEYSLTAGSEILKCKRISVEINRALGTMRVNTMSRPHSDGGIGVYVDIVVEDNVDNIIKIQKINYDAIYINIINSENEHNAVDNCIRIKNFSEIYKYFNKEKINV
jgi:hypothetical protein